MTNKTSFCKKKALEGPISKMLATLIMPQCVNYMLETMPQAILAKIFRSKFKSNEIMTLLDFF